MKSKINICEDSECTGCMACLNVCPRNCISIKIHSLGHAYPHIDASNCINCNLCKSVCQVLTGVDLKKPISAFAGWSNNHDDYVSSSSGGAATVLAQDFINNGGIVYGSASLPGIEISHIRIDRLEDVNLLKGSKYVRSNLDKAFSEVAKDLKANRKVLFFGLPCQVMGLKKFLRTDNPSLYTVDLICHGSPSLHMLKKHVNKVGGSRSSSVEFRKGSDMTFKVFDSSRQVLYKSNVWRQRYHDLYYNAFMDGYLNRDSCYACKFATDKRCSDITIGDFWGIGDDFVYDRSNGLSLLMPVTEKGLDLLQTSNLKLFERPIEEAVKGNARLKGPKQLNNRIKLFRKLNGYFSCPEFYYVCESDHIINRNFISKIRSKLS